MNIPPISDPLTSDFPPGQNQKVLLPRWTVYFDITSVNAVESVFSRSSSKDLWGPEVLGTFANILIYADRASFPLPTLSREIDNISRNKSFDRSFLQHMQTIDSSFLNVIPFEKDKVDSIDVSRVPFAFSAYAGWAKRVENIPMIKSFSEYHRTPEVFDKHISAVGAKNMLDMRRLVPVEQLYFLSRFTGISEEDHLYCFDIVFRYGMYGDILVRNRESIGESSPYFHHPLRSAFSIPDANFGKCPPPKLPSPVSFASAFAKASHKFTQDEFFMAVKILRNLVDTYGLKLVPDSNIQVKTLRKMAIVAKMPARFKPLSPIVPRIIEYAIAAAGSVIAFDVLGTDVISKSMYAIGGAIGAGVPVTYAKNAWTNNNPLLPTCISGKTWFLPFIRFDIEDQTIKSKQ